MVTFSISHANKRNYARHCKRNNEALSEINYKLNKFFCIPIVPNTSTASSNFILRKLYYGWRVFIELSVAMFMQDTS